MPYSSLLCPAQEQNTRQNRRMLAINHLFLQAISCASVYELSGMCLGLAEKLTESKFGFVAMLNARGRMDAMVLSDPGWDASQIPRDAGGAMLRNMEIRGLWGKVTKDGLSLLTNEPDTHPDSVGVPEGHPPITAFLGVPLKHDGQTIGMIALANKEGGYDQDDLDDAEALAVAFVQAYIRARAEAALRESEQRYQQLLSAVTNYTYTVEICDDMPVETDHSAGCLAATGYAPEDYAADPNLWFTMIHPDDREMVRRQVGRVLAGEDVPPMEHRICRKDGATRWVHSTIVCHRNGSGRLVSYDGLVEDITERKELELQQREYADAVEHQAAAMEQLCEAAQAATLAKSEFLANMSHEIRTPMTAILGYADILADSLNRPEQLEALTVIRRAGKHLLAVISDILDLSKIEAGKFQMEPVACKPRAVLAEVVSLMRVRAGAKGLALKLEYAGPCPESVITDPGRLRQILINLVGNAIKFTHCGEVRIIVRLIGGDSPTPVLECRIADTGIGMTAEQVERVFQPFYQADGSTNRKFGGTGLGLPIAKRLAELLGGDISVASEPGKGSTFTLILPTGPLADTAMIDQPEEAGTAPAATCSSGQPCHWNDPLNGRILLVEDGPDNQRLIAFVLTKAGAEVTLAENGRIALDQALDAQARGEPFDVILMDMQMPVMDGYEATRRLRAAGYTLPIIGLTAHAMAGDRQKCLDAGCDEYLRKPIDRATFLPAVARHLRLSIMPIYNT